MARRCYGLSIIEVVFASLLLIMVIIPVLKCLSTANANSAIIEHKTRSLLLAQAKIDEIKARSIYNFTNSGSSFTISNLSLSDSYLCNITDNSGDPLKTITVSVGFDLNGNSTLSADEVDISLATLIARRWTD
jgi:Tfp pilus assembly protein PilV